MSATDSLDATRRPERRMRADAQRNYARLMAAANAAFAEYGPDACLEDIARQAEVGIGTLYRHFPTRQALLEAVYREQIEALTAKAEALRDAPSPGDALTSWLRDMLAYNLTQRGLKEALMNDEGSQLIPMCKVQLHTAGATLLARAQGAGDIRADLSISDVLRLVHGIALATEKAPEGQEQAKRLLAIMLDGLRRQEPGGE